MLKNCTSSYFSFIDHSLQCPNPANKTLLIDHNYNGIVAVNDYVFYF